MADTEGWRLIRGAEFGQFFGELLLAAFELGELVSDLACPQGPVERHPGVQRRGIVILFSPTLTRVVRSARARVVKAGSVVLNQRPGW